MSADSPRRSSGGSSSRRGTAPLPDELTLNENLSFIEVDKRIAIGLRTASLGHRLVAYYLAHVEEHGLHRLAGCRTVIEYAVVRHGASRTQARDLLAAGRALRELREIDRAFARRGLCWSKVRELVKVATPETEAAWLERALSLPIRELELEVRRARRGERPQDHPRQRPGFHMDLRVSMPPDVFASGSGCARECRTRRGASFTIGSALQRCSIARSRRPAGRAGRGRRASRVRRPAPGQWTRGNGSATPPTKPRPARTSKVVRRPGPSVPERRSRVATPVRSMRAMRAMGRSVTTEVIIAGWRQGRRPCRAGSARPSWPVTADGAAAAATGSHCTCTRSPSGRAGRRPRP